jgi:hypothetical protein
LYFGNEADAPGSFSSQWPWKLGSKHDALLIPGIMHTFAISGEHLHDWQNA